MEFENYSLNKQLLIIKFLTTLSKKEWTNQHQVSKEEHTKSRKEYIKEIILYRKLIKN